MYLEIFLADLAVFPLYFGNFAGFRGNTWILRVRDRAKYHKPCLVDKIALLKLLNALSIQ